VYYIVDHYELTKTGLRTGLVSPVPLITLVDKSFSEFKEIEILKCILETCLQLCSFLESYRTPVTFLDGDIIIFTRIYFRVGKNKNHRPVASHWQTLSHNVVSSRLRHKRDSNSQR
jgi:hypothetical protein